MPAKSTASIVAAEFAKVEAFEAQEAAKVAAFKTDLVAGVAQAVQAAVAPFAERLADANRRIDTLALLVTRLLKVSPTHAPTFVPRDEYDAALLELRGNDGESSEKFPTADIVAKAVQRRVSIAVYAAQCAVERKAA